MYYLIELDIYFNALKLNYYFPLYKKKHKNTYWFWSTHLFPVNQIHLDPSVPWTSLFAWTSFVGT